MLFFLYSFIRLCVFLCGCYMYALYAWFVILIIWVITWHNITSCTGLGLLHLRTRKWHWICGYLQRYPVRVGAVMNSVWAPGPFLSVDCFATCPLCFFLFFLISEDEIVRFYASKNFAVKGLVKIKLFVFSKYFWKKNYLF